MIDSIVQDLRVAVRQLARHRGFSGIVLVTLGLGIGATSTFFSVLNAVAFRPLPFPDPDQLVAVQRVAAPAGRTSRVAYATFQELARMPDAISSSVAYVPRTVTLSGAGAAEQIAAAEISGDLFALLGTPLSVGRSLQPADVGTPLAVISHQVWTTRFGSDPAVIGATAVIDGAAHTIVGLAPSGFGFPSDARVWLPLATTPASRAVDVVGRLRQGVSVTQGDAVLRTVPAPSSTNDRDGTTATLGAVPLRDVVLGTKQRDAALVLLAASALVLVVACANLAGLFLAHVSRRRHEMAVRAAIGAARSRLVRQFLTESLLLALAGGLFGAVLAQWGTDLFVSTLGKPGGAEWMAFTVDRRVMLFALAASVGTCLLFGLVPALGGSRVDIRGILQHDGRSAGAGPRGTRLRGALVAAQVALSLGLVAGGSSIVMSSAGMDDVDPGFDRQDLLALRVPLAGSAYDNAEQRLAFVDAALGRLRGLPGVSAAGAVSHAPLIDRNVPGTSFMLEEWTATPQPPYGSFRFVDANYIAAMRIAIRRGRTFTDAEARDTRGTGMVINETMARRHWPGEDPIGRRIRLPGAASPTTLFSVVGVVADVAQRQLPAQPENQMYFPLPLARSVTLVVRASSDAAVVAGHAREAVRGIDGTLAVTSHTMAGTYRAYAEDRRLQGFVLGSLGVVAVLVAALGIYGVMSLNVAERRREIAIRVALGGSRTSILKLVMGRALRMTSFGIAAGLALSIAVTAFLSSIFFGLQPFDPRVFAAAAALLGAVAAAASWFPARAAARVDPMSVLQR